jgi:hypothetical protein
VTKLGEKLVTRGLFILVVAEDVATRQGFGRVSGLINYRRVFGISQRFTLQ